MSDIAVPEQVLPRPALKFAPTQTESFGIELECIVVALRGALTAANAAAVRTQLFALAVDAGPKDLLLDLSRVSAIDSVAADVLLVVQRVQRLQNRAMEIEAVSAAVGDFILRNPAVGHELRQALGTPESWQDDHLAFEQSDPRAV